MLRSLRRLITFLKTKRDLLMSMDSLAIVCVVAWIFSDPARSTNYNLEVTTVSSRVDVGSVTVSTVKVKMQWDLEDWWLRLCDATTLFLRPSLKRSSASDVLAHSNTKRFSTTNCSFFVHLILKPYCCWCYYFLSFSPTAFLNMSGVDSGFNKSNTLSL